MALIHLLRSRWSLCLCITSVLCNHCGVAKAHPHDFEGWSLFNAHLSLNERKSFQVYLEGQPRVGDNWQRAATAQARAALVYNHNSRLGLYAGYAWTPSFYNSSYHRDYRDEQRFWQQAVYRHDLLGIAVAQRVRQEQRVQMRTAGMGHRFRYMCRAAYGLTHTNDIGVAAFDEIMINLNDVEGGAWRGYDRNRLFLGPYWRVKHVSYEVGYLAEHAKRFGSDERWVHAIVAAVQYSY